MNAKHSKEISQLPLVYRPIADEDPAPRKRNRKSVTGDGK